MAYRDGQVTRLSFRTKFLLAVALFIGVFAAVGGFSWVYIHLIKDDPPPKLSFEQRDKELAATTVPAGK